jgi:hypothetical protein
VYPLPTVMTCSNLLRLPDHGDAAIVREKLLRAMEETPGGFQLS